MRFLHGFTAPQRSRPLEIDTPSHVWFVDARTGQLSEELRYDGAHASFPAADLDREAMATLDSLHDQLAPPFFRGAPRVPQELEAAALTYRQTFPKAVQPEYVSIYRTHAADWFAWVGL